MDCGEIFSVKFFGFVVYYNQYNKRGDCVRKSISVFGIGCLMSLMVCIPVWAEIPADKTPTVGTWQEADENWYFIGEDGTKKTGWVRYENNWYYCDDATGEMLANEVTPEGYFVKTDGKWNGQPVLEVYTYMHEKPENLTYGWHEINHEWRKTYFVKEDGDILISEWACIDGDYYYFSEDGIRLRNNSPEGFHLTNSNGKWNRCVSEYEPEKYISPEIPEDNYFAVNVANAREAAENKKNTWDEYTNGNGDKYKHTRYIEADGLYFQNGWKRIADNWYYFKNCNLVKNKWVGDYYVGEDGAMLVSTTTPDGKQVDEDGLRIGAYTAQSKKSISTVDAPNYATYLADGTQALKPFVLIGFVNRGNDLITIYQRNSFYSNGAGSANMPCSSMKRYINADESEMCTSYTVSPKGSAMMIFYIDGNGTAYNADSVLQFGIEYKGKGYLCKVTSGTTECVPIETVGMSLDMFK